jgi:hypothetical protein
VSRLHTSCTCPRSVPKEDPVTILPAIIIRQRDRDLVISFFVIVITLLGLTVQRVAAQLSDWLQHKENDHRNWIALFQCSRCGKSYKSKHSLLCHIPKCPGAPKEVDNVAREKCPLKFRSRRGLSQHERSAHPVVRNEKRMLAAQPAAPFQERRDMGKCGRRRKLN